MMHVMLENRSDDRIDALSAKVDDLGAQMEKGFKRVDAQIEQGFARVDTELRELRQGMKVGFDRVDDRFLRVDERFERVDDRFERMQRLMIQFYGAIVVALIGLAATQL